MQFLAPWAAVALLAVPAIVALYFLKVRRSEVNVASLLFWPQHLVDRQATSPWQRLRWSALLAVQLVVAAALAVALMRPGVPGEQGLAATTVVMIDGSPSMQATDVRPSRFASAVAQALRMSRELGSGRQMAVVVLGAHAQQLSPPSSDPGVLGAALDRARPSAQEADLGEGIELANAILAGRSGGSVILLSDGGLKTGSGAERLRAPLTYRSIGVTGDNVGIESLVRRADGGVVVGVVNVGLVERDTEVELLADGRLVDVLALHVGGASSVSTTWTALPAGTGVLEARLHPSDAFALDDRAWLVVDAAARRRVLVVSGGNGFLRRALELRADLDVTVVDPARYQPGHYDLYVFDGFVPSGPLPQPALVVNPAEGTGPVPASTAVDPGAVLPADPREPLLRYVNLRDVHVQAASTATPPPEWRTVIAAANGPLLLVHQGEPRLAQLTFDLHRSDLPLRPAFPVLVHNIVSYLLGGGFESEIVPLGQPVRVGGDAGVTAVEVTRPDGTRHRLRPPFPADVADTGRPGVYRVRTQSPEGARTSLFVVAPDVPRQSHIALGPVPEVGADPPRAGLGLEGVAELWPWLALAALAGLGIEWVVFLRG